MSIDRSIDRKVSSIALRCPLDNFEECSIPILQWLSEPQPEMVTTPLDRHVEYLRACAAYASNPYADFDLRTQPHVAYNIVSDMHYFIFKQDNNGTCIIAGERLPKFSAWDVMG